MRFKRYALSCLFLFLLSLGWNALVHLVLLRKVHAVVQHLRRPDFADKMLLSLLLTAGFVCLFVWGYARFTRTGSLREGALYGVFIALLAGLLVDFNQYLLYPIPAWVAFVWFLGGLVEFTLYGVLLAAFRAPRTAK